jgi:hypothetical protein
VYCTNSPDNRVKPSQNHHREDNQSKGGHLSGHSGDVGDEQSADDGADTGQRPGHGKDSTNADTHRQGGLLVVGHGPHGDACS